MKLKPFSHWSLRLQMALVFSALAVAATAALSYVWISMLTPRIEQAAADGLQAVAHNAARTLSEGLFERSREMELLANAEPMWVNGLEDDGVRQILALSQSATPSSRWIGVADLRGVVRSATGNLLVGQSVKERPWYAKGLKGVYVGDVHAAKLLAALLPPAQDGAPERFVDFAAPIKVDGVVVGVLAAHGTWDWTRRVIESLMPPRARELGLSVFIFDRAGNVIYAPDGQTDRFAAEGQKLPVLDPARAISVGNGIHVAVVPWKDGQDYLTSVVRLPARTPASDLGWHVVASMPVSVAFIDERAATQRAIWVGLAVAVLATGLAWLAAARLSAHLSAITAAAGEVRAGRPGAQIPLLHSSADVHQLSTALHGMTERLMHVQEETEQRVRDRTRELEKATQELANQARTDPMTGLLNRRGFEPPWQHGLALARRSGRPLSVVMVDIDHFKRVNDTFGHETGDVVIKHLAQLMTSRLRGTDWVARLGGEEFVAMLPDTDVDQAERIARELVQAMAAQELPAVGRVTISAGVAGLAPDVDDGAMLLRRADAALYQAKHGGRNQACAWSAGA
ncbi:GGDEF domain-containing protein [Rhodoferax koreense]|uniref:diguanylate cyclase n=1 Tax=Rhodoferax koreensis TaxID=1842727 RepID=A0A1P8JXY6_9BURK|nr:sensor domain-containing diguanylate cyclase [Rhodoferax koreense]APW38607.1 GGDEF domain-containing protein [Rhodoferax koreense]